MSETSSKTTMVGALAQTLTVGETYFFRNQEQFRALAEIAWPERKRAQAAARRLRILSAGCSSGEEPYSIAITARETIADPAWKIAIRAVDINPAAFEIANPVMVRPSLEVIVTLTVFVVPTSTETT